MQIVKVLAAGPNKVQRMVTIPTSLAKELEGVSHMTVESAPGGVLIYRPLELAPKGK